MTTTETKTCKLRSQQPVEENEMSYDTASELLGLTTPKSLADQARLATFRLNTFTHQCPLRYQVACRVLINEYEESKEN